MKFFIVFALCVAAASAGVIAPVVVADEAAEIQQILDAIHHPSTDPATAAALEQMLNDLLGIKPEPISVGPAIVDGEYEPISVGPAIVDGEYDPISVGPVIVDGEYEPISVGPAIVEGEYEPISVGPAIVDEVIPAPVAPVPESSPLVQIIINVKPGVAGNPVTVEGIDTSPVIVVPSPEPELLPVIVLPSPEPEPVIVDQPEIEPTPVIVVEQPEATEPIIVAPVIVPEPVIVGQPEVEPTPVIVVEQPEAAEPVIVSPVIIPEPVVVLPDILN